MVSSKCVLAIIISVCVSSKWWSKYLAFERVGNLGPWAKVKIGCPYRSVDLEGHGHCRPCPLTIQQAGGPLGEDWMKLVGIQSTGRRWGKLGEPCFLCLRSFFLVSSKFRDVCHVLFLPQIKTKNVNIYMHHKCSGIISPFFSHRSVSWQWTAFSSQLFCCG